MKTVMITYQRHNTTPGTKACFAELWLDVGLSFDEALSTQLVILTTFGSLILQRIA